MSGFPDVNGVTVPAAETLTIERLQAPVLSQPDPATNKFPLRSTVSAEMKLKLGDDPELGGSTVWMDPSGVTLRTSPPFPSEMKTSPAASAATLYGMSATCVAGPPSPVPRGTG